MNYNYTAEELDKIPLETKYIKLERLVKWEHVGQVNQMLLTDVSPHKVSEWCNEHGFKISHPKLYEYKEMLQDAITRQITVERLLGIGVPKRKPILINQIAVQDAKTMVRNELEVLDGIIQLGMNALYTTPQIKIQDAMRAIELKNKLTAGQHGGMTSYGLDLLRKVEQAKFQVIIEAVLEFVPEDKHSQIEEAIAKAEREYYEQNAPELLEAYDEKYKQELQEMDNEIVSDSPY